MLFGEDENTHAWTLQPQREIQVNSLFPKRGTPTGKNSPTQACSQWGELPKGGGAGGNLNRPFSF